MTIAKIAAALGGIVVASSAVAADLPSRKAPPPYLAPAPVVTWRGIYAGLNAGADFRLNGNNNSYAFATTGGNRNANFVGGGQIGYNWQAGPLVFGVETDAQYRGYLGGTNNAFFGAGGNNGGGFLGTTRGRVGYAFTPTFMLYATSGLAYGSVANNGFGSFPFGFGNNSSTDFRVGYAAGGGLEYLFTPSWSVKAEFLYVDLGRGNNNSFVFNNNTRAQFGVARLGLNYHFNTFVPTPVVARY